MLLTIIDKNFSFGYKNTFFDKSANLQLKM